MLSDLFPNKKMTAEKQFHELNDLLEGTGVSAEEFLARTTEPSPRPPNDSEIRAYLQNELSPIAREEVRALLITYKDWDDARRRIDHESADEREKR